MYVHIPRFDDQASCHGTEAKPFRAFHRRGIRSCTSPHCADEEARQIELAFGEGGTETERASGWGWSEDFLVLLSLESEELRLKVERFRREELHITELDEEKRFEERRSSH